MSAPHRHLGRSPHHPPYVAHARSRGGRTRLLGLGSGLGLGLGVRLALGLGLGLGLEAVELACTLKRLGLGLGSGSGVRVIGLEAAERAVVYEVVPRHEPRPTSIRQRHLVRGCSWNMSCCGPWALVGQWMIVHRLITAQVSWRRHLRPASLGFGQDGHRLS